MGEVKHTPGPWAICADGISVGPNDGFQPFGGCGCCGSPWMTGNHATGTAEARRKAERDERDARFAEERRLENEASQRRAERFAMAKAEIESLARMMAAPREQPPMTWDACLMAQCLNPAAEGLDIPLPWRATDAGLVLAANDKTVVNCREGYWPQAAAAEVTRALMIAMAANTAAGLATPPLEITEPEQAIDGSDPDAGHEGEDIDGGEDDA